VSGDRNSRTQRPAQGGQLRRHPRGGYARGVRTRRRIIETAIEMFAAHGYEETSTRAIARRARVSLPALQYYFGSKAGLHRACAAHVTDDTAERLAPAAAEVRRALQAPRLSRRELLRLLRSVIEPLLEGMATDRPESWVLFFTRAQSGRTPATDVILKRMAGPLIELCAQIIGRILQFPPHDPEVRVRTVSVIGQIVMVRRGRPFVLHALGWRNFEGARLEILKGALWRGIEASLVRTRLTRSVRFS
jgi:AcrR family transcriptional regulator